MNSKLLVRIGIVAMVLFAVAAGIGLGLSRPERPDIEKVSPQAGAPSR
jgi:hypothetical protein